MIICGMMLYQDGNERCALEVGHLPADEHKTQAMIDWSPTLEVKPHTEPKTIYVDAPGYREVSLGTGLIYTFPVWVADVLQAHPEEVAAAYLARRLER